MKEEDIKKLNIYEKLQKCRMELNKKKLTKSGHNKYSDYKYFELSDFLPTVNELFFQNKLSSEFNIYDKVAILKIIDTEDNKSQIVFKIPVADVNIKGSSPIQALGGQLTYLRRYLYINALEIAENDMVDSQSGKISDEEKELTLIYMCKMKDLVAKTGTDYTELLNHFKVKSDTELNLKQLKVALAILEKKMQKNKEEVF